MSQTALGTDGLELQQGEYDYCTPLEVVAPIARILGGFDLDPCASPKSSLAELNVRDEGGLEVDWGQYQTVWCNHPFEQGEPDDWLGKAAECDADTVVALSRGDPSASWFQEHVMEADLICFPEERIQFVGFEKGYNFPLVFSVYGEYPAALREHFEDLGWVATADTGYDELVISHDSGWVLDRVSRADVLEVDVAAGALGAPEFVDDTLTVEPISRQVTEDGDFELCCIQHGDPETWVVLGHPVGEPGDLWCAVAAGDRGFRTVPIDGVTLRTDPRETHAPSTAIETA